MALALSGGHVYAAWENGPRLEVWQDGKVEELAPAGTFPALCTLPDGGMLAAWEQNGSIEMKRLPW